MAKLVVNVDHIATIRQARGVDYPDPLAAAILAELAGADGIVVHLREDRRHIQDRDVRLIREAVQGKFVLEMAATTEMETVATAVKPDLVTLVPEKRQELTTEGGLDLNQHGAAVAETVARLNAAQIPVCIFVDPEPDQIRRAEESGAKAVEIHTGTLCEAPGRAEKEKAMQRIIQAIDTGRSLRLAVNAGHGLDYHTIEWFTGIREIGDFSIGHSIVARAVLVGMEKAVAEMHRRIAAL